MGGPKALLAWDHGTLTSAHVRLRKGDCDRVVVVARAWVAACLRPMFDGVTVVSSSAPGEWGPAGSIAAAVRAGALARADWALVVPVDLVPTRGSTVQQLLDARGPGITAIRPRFEGRGGHPVLVRTALIASAYLAKEPPPLRDVLRLHAPIDVDVHDPDIRVDLDTPDAYRSLTGEQPRFVAV